MHAAMDGKKEGMMDIIGKKEGILDLKTHNDGGRALFILCNHVYPVWFIFLVRILPATNSGITINWSILTKRRQLVFSGGLHQTTATITSFEGLVG